MSRYVFDASALIALILEERGAELVAKRMKNAMISAVNYTEVASRLIRDGMDYGETEQLLDDLNLHVIPHDQDLAMLAAKIFPLTKSKGLSTGDRACLALAIRKKAVVITADKIWANLRLGVTIEVIR